MAGIGEADGGIGDRALPSFRAVSDLRIHMRFETGYWTRIDNFDERFHVFTIGITRDHD